MVDEHIAGDEQQQAEHHAHHAGTQADDKGLGVEHLRDVVLGGTDGAQNADLLAALQHADIGDDADHDGGHHQRDRHKGHQHIADHAHDFGDRVHQSAHHIGIVDHLTLFALLPHGGVVGVQLVHHLRLGVKAVGVDIDGIGLCVVHIADVVQNLFVAGSGGKQGTFDHLGQVGAGHVDLNGLLEHSGVDLECAFHLRAQLRNIALDGLRDLLLQLPGQLLDGGTHLLLQSGGELGLQRLAQLDGVGLHHGLQILLEGTGKLLLQPGGVQQITHGFGKQRLEGLGLHIGGKTDLIQIQQAVADEIALVAVHDLFHQCL